MVRDFHRNVGAEIMGRNKFGPQRGPWADHDWQGWWGQQPPFHTPVLVMTHHDRPSFRLSDTTFYFIGGDPVLPRLSAGATDWAAGEVQELNRRMDVSPQSGVSAR